MGNILLESVGTFFVIKVNTTDKLHNLIRFKSSRTRSLSLLKKSSENGASLRRFEFDKSDYELSSNYIVG